MLPPLDISFNSKLVRLKVKPYEDTEGKLTMFQFQTGAIKSHNVFSHACPITSSFNSKLVRLKVTSLIQSQGFGRKVSIPNWCD